MTGSDHPRASSPLHAVPRHDQSGELPITRFAEEAADRALDGIAPRLAKTIVKVRDIPHQRALDDLCAAERCAGSTSALAREIGRDESEIRVVRSHAQRNVPLKWVHAVGDEIWLAFMVSLSRHRSPRARRSLAEKLVAMNAEEAVEARSA